jgi:hypothetical protein
VVSERSIDLLELHVYLEPAVTPAEADRIGARLAEQLELAGARATRSAVTVKFTDARGPE